MRVGPKDQRSSAHRPGQSHGVVPEESTDTLADEGRLDKEMIEVDLSTTQHYEVRDAYHFVSNHSAIGWVALDDFGMQDQVRTAGL